MILYISGSITDGGTITDIAEINFRLNMFSEAEVVLNNMGYGILNPARHGHLPGFTWQDYMRLALADISNAGGIALLPGWEKSRGARAERSIAELLDIPAKPIKEWER